MKIEFFKALAGALDCEFCPFYPCKASDIVDRIYPELGPSCEDVLKSFAEDEMECELKHYTFEVKASDNKTEITVKGVVNAD